MKLFYLNNVPGVLLMSLVLLANAQRTSNNFRDVDLQELARQNKITKQILEAFIQKKLGLTKGYVRPPSIQEILPIKKPEERNVRQSNQSEQLDETHEFPEDDSLQSVESEQIDSVYSEGLQNEEPAHNAGRVQKNRLLNLVLDPSAKKREPIKKVAETLYYKFVNNHDYRNGRW